MFRFATSDYYSHDANIIQIGEGFLWSDKQTEGQAYIAQESVFLDFDIIQLTFNKEGDYTVIPVVSSPIDIVNDITPPVFMPDEGLEWWQIALALILLVLLIVVLAPVLPYIISGIVWLIGIPMKLIKVISKAFKRQKKRKEHNNNSNDFYKEE